MAERTLIALVQKDTGDPQTWIVASPIVGLLDGMPKAGVYLNPLDRVSTVKVLNRRYSLRMPRDLQGRVCEVFVPNLLVPIAYGDPLVRLDPRGIAAGGTESEGGSDAMGTSGDPAGAGMLTISAPTQGIFYRRPTPDAPPFVEVGSRIHAGAILGFVEVMKCFSQITYGGPGFPEVCEVAKILAEDSTEIQFGQPLFIVKAIA